VDLPAGLLRVEIHAGVAKDEEGMKTMRDRSANMARLLKKLAV
jgi:hypothetical protein